LRIFDLVWHENAIFRFLEFLDFSNQVEEKKCSVRSSSTQTLYSMALVTIPFTNLAMGLGEIACDNMMTTAKALDFPVLEK